MSHPPKSNRRVNYAWCIFALAFLLIAAPALGQGRPIIILSTFPSHGMGVLHERILTEAYARIGYDLEIVRVPAQRALALSGQGVVDGEAGRVAVIEKLYPSLIRIPTPIYQTRVVAFTNKLDLDLQNGFEALRPYRLASVRGYKFIESKTEGMDRHLCLDYETLFKLLDEHRIDIAISEYLEAYANMGGEFPSGVRVLTPPLASEPIYHYLHEKNAALVPLISKALKEMSASGRIHEIFETLMATYRQGKMAPTIPGFMAPCENCSMLTTDHMRHRGEAVAP